MILDAQLMISSEQDITAEGTTVSDNVIDCLAKGDAYNNLYGVVQSVEAAAGGTSVQAKIVTADDAAFTENKTTLLDTGALLDAALTANTVHIKQRLAKGVRRYIRGEYIGVGTHTAGTFNMFLTPEVPHDNTLVDVS